MADKYGFVYLWYDIKHQRYYVGCHWGTETDGYICSSNWMRDAYTRRPQDFRRRILKTNIPDRQSMLNEEHRLLLMIKPHELKRRYYNLKINRDNQWHHSQSQNLTIGQKISAAKKGKSTGPCSEERARKISEAKKQAFASGKTIITDEWRHKNSEARKGKDTWMKGKCHSEETRKKMSEINKGRKQSEETIAKKVAAMKGQKRSDETKKKMSQSTSKEYIVTRNGETFKIRGLKQYAKDNNIPYTSLHKAFTQQTSIQKYNISSIVSSKLKTPRETWEFFVI